MGSTDIQENEDEDETCVARIRFVSPSQPELFALRIIHLERSSNRPADARKWEGVVRSLLKNALIAMGLHQDGFEYESV